MFFNFKAAAALLAVLPLAVRATLSITTPTNWNTSGTATLTYTGAATDPTFSVELNNGGLLQYGSLAVGNNLSPTTGTFTFQVPAVPAGTGYTITFVNIGNITDVYATSGSFTMGAAYTPPSSSTSSAPATVAVTPAAITVKPASTPNAQANSLSAASASSAASAATPFSSTPNGAASISPKAGVLGGILAAGLAMAWL